MTDSRVIKAFMYSAIIMVIYFIVFIMFTYLFTSCTTKQSVHSRFTKCKSKLGNKKKDYYNSIQYN